jgi:hypothetical protein
VNEDEITICSNVRASRGQRGRVYYYQGNIFQPMGLHGEEISSIRKAIKMFYKEYSKRIVMDRKHPNYKTLVELAEEQYKEYSNKSD